MESDSTLLSEDDSLLQPTPTRIAHRISPMKYSTIHEDSAKDNRSSSKDTSNKENISVNKSEGPKLNTEPVQMKKKRRGGGYNLRKSLAWDRAFFTEEGVLDPLELSMISGTHINSSREGLSTINEDDSLSNDYGSNNDSADMQALEENLFKEIPAVSLKKDLGTVHSPPKHNLPACGHRASTSVASPSVLPTRGGNKTGSRTGGCPRPLPLLSLKRPANTNACQAVAKESKLPRIPIPKPGHSSNLVTKKSITQGASHMKQKQTSQPVINLQNQRNVGLKSSLKSVKYNQNKTKAGSGSLLVKSSVSHSKRTVVNSSIYPNSSTQLYPSVGKKVTNTNAKVTPDDVSPSIVVPPYERQVGSTKLPASLPCGTSISRSNMQHKQFPSLKPSGLRIPSPSLGFFCQPKSPVSNCAPQRAIDADIPGLRKPGYLRPPYSPVKIAEAVNDIKQTVDTVVLRSGSHYRSASHERMKKNVGEDAKEKSLKILNEDEPSEPTNDRNIISGNASSSIPGCGESKLSTNIDKKNCDSSPQQITLSCAKGIFITRNSIENSSVEHGDILESSRVEVVKLPCGDEHLSEEKGTCRKDSQNLSHECLENADFVTPASREIELKSSGPSSEESYTKLKKYLILGDADPPLQNGETKLLMSKIISTAGSNDNPNRNLEVGDLNNFSGKSLELQSLCLAQNSQNKLGLSAAGTVLIEKGSEEYSQEVTEKLPVTMLEVVCKSELGNSGEISEVPVAMQNERFDVSKKAGEALAGDSLQTFFEIASSVENHNCSVTRCLGSDVDFSSEITSSYSHSALNEGSKSFVTDECGTFNGNNVQNKLVNEDDLMVEEPESLTLFSPLDSEIADLGHGSLLAENKFHVGDQNTDHQNVPEAKSIVYDSPVKPLEKANMSRTANAMQIDEHRKEVTSSSNILQVEDEALQKPDCKVPVQCCIKHMHVASNQFMPVIPTKRSGEAGLPNFCIVVEKFPEIKGSLLTENCLSGERNVLPDLEENIVLKSRVDALPKTTDSRGGELESSRPFSSMPLFVHFSDDAGDKFNDASCLVHRTSSCEEVEPSSESYVPFTGSEMRRGLEHGDLISSRHRNQGSSRSKKSTLLDETKAQVASDTDNLAVGSNIGMEAACSWAKDKDTTASIQKSESSSRGNSVSIIPPINAVPFSDEWLATMEAAGEDILKMKSGAVQNSPTDKSLPEPSPWSPVKRKNNTIGPFDCTKCTNNFPSDSH